MEKQKGLFDVVVVEDATGKIVSIIGKDLNERQMEKRIETGVGRVDMSRFHVLEVTAGSKIVGQEAR